MSTDLPDDLVEDDVVALGFRLVDGHAVLARTEHDSLLPAPAPQVLGRAGASGSAGEVVEVPRYDDAGPGRVLLVGLGDDTPDDVRRSGAALARRVRGRTRVCTTLGADVRDDAAREALVEGLVLGSFAFDLKSRASTTPVERVVLTGLGDDAEGPVRRGRTRAAAAWTSRALALTPSNIKNPAWLADRAAEVARAHDLTLRVWERGDLEADAFGGILAVGQGSVHEPRLIRLDYAPEGARKGVPHVVLVGKGITFDTGGLSVKGSDDMAKMKRDMTGAGVVLAVMGALRDLGCPVRVTGLLACAENAMGGSALRPGDVVRHHGGRTSEITNTDAEGRLVLADAMAYAVDALDPTVLVDVATLTGAVRVALGQRLGGLFSDDDDLVDELVEAGRRSGEPVWHLPMVEDYLERIESGVADADNAGGSPGAITAALFLRPFAGEVRWAHLDLASVGDSPTDQYEWTQGATGFGARLLLRWLCDTEEDAR